MTTDYSVLNDQLVTMAFITGLTGLTDKWFYKLIKTVNSRSPLSWGEAPAGLKAKWKPGYRNASRSPVSNLSNAVTFPI